MQLIILSLSLLILNCVGGWQILGGSQNQKEKWVEPNAWAQEVEVISTEETMSNDDFCPCQGENGADMSADNQAALFFFKKFVRLLFQRDKLQYDEIQAVFQRELLFKILPNQLERLEMLRDPRDLDSVLTEIFSNAATPNKSNSRNGTWSSIFALIWDILKDLFLLLRFSEVQFISIVLLIVLIGYFIHRKHNIGVVAMILGGFFLFGYFVTYLECNRELEIKQMLDVIEKNEASKSRESSWISPLTRWWGGGNENVVKSKHEQIKRASKINLAFCRPDHVLMLYANDLFLKQLEFLIDKCTTTLLNIRNTLGFPYNYIAAIGLLFLIGYIIKLSFEHVISPRVWTGYFHRSGRGAQGDTSADSEDRLSGENLKMLLSAISTSTSSLRTKNSSEPAISCVQEVVESLEAAVPGSKSDISNSSSNNSLSNNSATSSRTSSPNSSIQTTTDQLEALLKRTNSSDGDFILISQSKTEVTLEDAPDD